MVLAVLNPLEWVFCDSPQFIRGRCLDETDDETSICCIRSQRFKTPLPKLSEVRSIDIPADPGLS